MTRNITNNPEDRINMEDDQKEAYSYGINNAVEYTNEIGKTDLALMTAEEILTFAECMCKNYHTKIIELNKQNV